MANLKFVAKWTAEREKVAKIQAALNAKADALAALEEAEKALKAAVKA